jgi:beta-glucosidase
MKLLLALLFIVTYVTAKDIDKENAPWMNINLSPSQRARLLVSHMTGEEKRSMLYGTGDASPTQKYVGGVPGIPRLHMPPLKYNDGPQGFRDNAMPGSTTAWPSGLTVAASWDVTTLENWGAAMGKEFFDKGANVQLGPGVCVARVPKNGRNFEYLSGEDPHLGYILVQPVIDAIQGQQIVANAKHYVNNNQETNRHFVSENVDERTRFEMYYPPFKGAIEAGVGSMMCSYNKINHVWSCENNSTLLTDLKIRMGFNGYVMSDWGATHSLSIEQGLDQEMPLNKSFNQISLKTVPEHIIDDSVVRILTPFFSVGTFDNPNSNQISNNVTSLEHVEIARKLSENSTILLKNEEQVLPLLKHNLQLAVVGTQAWNPVVHGGGSGEVVPAWVKPPLWSLCDMLDVERVNGTTSGSHNCNTGNNNCVTYYDSTTGPPPNTLKYDVIIMFVETTSSEGRDRTNLTFSPEQEEMLSKWSGLTGKNLKKVLVMSTPGAVLTPWSDNIDSILLNFMPGQAMGDAITNVIFGDINPSGKLPLTFPNKENEQLMTEAQYPGLDNAGNATYTEGFFFGYRWYDKHKVTPKYSFGHGLSYTTFSYGKILINGRTISCDITNTGKVYGAEVVQIYVGFGNNQKFGSEQRDEPIKQLKGFEKYYLNPTETVTATFTLTDRDLSYWNIDSKQWSLKVGKAAIFIGSSSTDIRDAGVMNVE